jgi:hypothetical protein
LVWVFEVCRFLWFGFFRFVGFFVFLGVLGFFGLGSVDLGVLGLLHFLVFVFLKEIKISKKLKSNPKHKKHKKTKTMENLKKQKTRKPKLLLGKDEELLYQASSKPKMKKNCFTRPPLYQKEAELLYQASEGCYLGFPPEGYPSVSEATTAHYRAAVHRTRSVRVAAAPAAPRLEPITVLIDYHHTLDIDRSSIPHRFGAVFRDLTAANSRIHVCS